VNQNPRWGQHRTGAGSGASCGRHVKGFPPFENREGWGTRYVERSSGVYDVVSVGGKHYRKKYIRHKQDDSQRTPAIEGERRVKSENNSGTRKHPHDEQERISPQSNTMKASQPDWWMVGLTGLLCLITFLQWKAARDAINDARQTFQSGNRAYITMMKATIKPTVVQASEPGQQWPLITIAPRTTFDLSAPYSYLEAELRNTGDTPATWVNIRVWTSMSDHVVAEPSEDLHAISADFPSTQNGISAVLSKDATLVPSIHSPEIRPEDFTLIRTGKKFLTLFGVVKYNDMFGQSHTTHFCSMYNPVVDGMVPCYKGNTLD